MDGTFTVATYNLKRASRWQFLHSWKKRREVAVETIRRLDAAIIGVQELLPAMREDLQQRLDEYDIFGVGRTKKQTNECSALLLRRRDVTLLDLQTIWLSKRPTVSGSRALFAAFPRICTIGTVLLKSCHRSIRVLNTHLDHISGYARRLGVRTILTYIHALQQAQPLPVIVMGDLNTRPTSKAIRLLSEKSDELHLTSVFEGEGVAAHNTFHGFSGKIRITYPIDYIFVSEEFVVQRAYMETYHREKLYPSDHFPLAAELSFHQPPGIGGS